MWIVRKTPEEQELLNKAIAKAMTKTNEKFNEGSVVFLALKEFVKRG